MFLLVITFAVAVAVALTIVTVVVAPLGLWWQKGQPSRAEAELARGAKRWRGRLRPSMPATMPATPRPAPQRPVTARNEPDAPCPLVSRRLSHLPQLHVPLAARSRR